MSLMSLAELSRDLQTSSEDDRRSTYLLPGRRKLELLQIFRTALAQLRCNHVSVLILIIRYGNSPLAKMETRCSKPEGRSP